MTPDEFKKRTKTFALKIIELVESLPRNKTTDILGNQLLRAGTSVGANYRASCRAKSRADFISKMTTVEEEIDETIYWMEILEESRKADVKKLLPIKREASELVAITVASIKTARKNKQL